MYHGRIRKTKGKASSSRFWQVTKANKSVLDELILYRAAVAQPGRALG